MSVLELGTYGPTGIFADPKQVTDLARFLQNANSRAAAASLVVSGAPSLLFGFTVSSAKASAQFVQIHDASSLPADGAVPLLSFPVATTADVAAAWIPPRGFNNGIVFCNSTTQHTKSIGSADCIFDVQFVT